MPYLLFLLQQYVGLDVPPTPPDNESIVAIRKMMEEAIKEQWHDIWWVVAAITVATTVVGNVLSAVIQDLYNKHKGRLP